MRITIITYVFVGFPECIEHQVAELPVNAQLARYAEQMPEIADWCVEQGIKSTDELMPCREDLAMRRIDNLHDFGNLGALGLFACDVGAIMMVEISASRLWRWTNSLHKMLPIARP